MMRNKVLALLLAAMLVLSILPAVATAEEEVCYTLDGTITGSNSAYASEGNITQNGISWKVMGNITMNPWRIGGKNLSGVDRPIYSTAPMNETVTKVEVDIGGITLYKVNSLTLYVAGDASFSTLIATKTTDTVDANSTITFTPSEGETWTDAYYKFVFNVTTSGSSNQYVHFKAARFYKEGSGEPPTTYTVTFNAGEGTGTMEAMTTTGSLTLPACTFTAPDGYVFAGWKTDGDDTVYATGTAVTVTADTTFTAQWARLLDMKLKRTIAANDVVAIYNPNSSVVMGTEDYLYNSTKHELAPISVTLNGDVIAVPENAAILTVIVNEGNTFSFKTADNKYLSVDSTHVQLVDEASEFTEFVLENAGTDTYYIRCSTATNDNSEALYLQYYHDYFTVYTMNASYPERFAFNFCSEDGEGPSRFTVSFDANGGEGTMEAVENVTSPYTLPESGFTAPEGTVFGGWKMDGDDTVYAAGTAVMLTGNVTFRAQWFRLLDMKLKRTIANGDTVVIYNPNSGVVMGTEGFIYNSKHELAQIPVSLSNNILSVPENAAILTVIVNEDETLSFLTADEKYLYVDSSDVRFADEAGEFTAFVLENAGTDTYYIRCNTATYSNGSPQYLQLYNNGFSVFSLNTSYLGRYAFNFYSEDGEGPAIFTVSFDANGGEGTMEDAENVTNPYTLPENGFTAPEGMVFTGWKMDGGDGTVYAAGTQVTLEEPNVTFIAQWKELEAKTYRLVTSDDDLVDGKTYLIASELFTDELYLMSNQTSNNRAQYKLSDVEGTTITLDESWIATNVSDALVFEFTLGADGDNWTFYDEVTGGYLYAASSSSNWLRTKPELDDNGRFAIDVGVDGAAIPVAIGSNTRKYMHYNSGSSIFSCYAETSTVTAAVYLYKLVEDEPETLENGFYLIGPDWTVDSISAANKFGVNVDNAGEYILAATLAENDQIKVVKVENGAITAWYPDGMNNQYTVDAAHAGDVNIYFRENYNNDWAAFGGFFYIEAGYNILCVSGGHGLVSSAYSRAAEGTTITLTVEPEEGYLLDALTVMCGETAVELTKISSEQYSFVMPAGSVTVTATFTLPQPSFKTVSLVLSGKIGVNFWMDLTALSDEDKEASYMTFAISGRGNVSDEPVVFDAEKINDKGYYSFACYVNAIQMADTITATFHYGEGQTISMEYSIETYIGAFESVEDQYDGTTVALVRALADYGHYVQLFLADVKTWSLGDGDDQYMPMDRFYASDYDHDEIASRLNRYAIDRYNGDPNINGEPTYTLVLDSETAIKLYFKPVAGFTGDLTVTGDGGSYTVPLKSKRWTVEIPNISAHLLGETYTVTVNTDSTGGNARASVSAMSYVYGVLTSDAYADNMNAKNAVSSIYAYWQAAAAYQDAH